MSPTLTRQRERGDILFSSFGGSQLAMTNSFGIGPRRTLRPIFEFRIFQLETMYGSTYDGLGYLEDFLELLGPMPNFIVREFPNGQDLGFFNSVDGRIDARAENVLPDLVGKNSRGLPG
jgi:hypothetical protein